MIKKLLDNIFFKKPSLIPDYYIVAQLNDKIMPIDRGEVYEDPLNEFLTRGYYGEVSGGGTLQHINGEIKYCDVEINLINIFNKEAIGLIIEKLEKIGAPKGSKLIIEKTGEQIEFGKLEGLAIYLDGVNLSKEVYENSDLEELASEICRLAGINSEIIRHWQGNTETGLYFYGKSFLEMKNSIAEFIKSYPLSENARIEQIA